MEEITLDQKCELIVNSNHIQEADIRERDNSIRIVWRNDPNILYQLDSPVLMDGVDDALGYIQYLENNTIVYG